MFIPRVSKLKMANGKMAKIVIYDRARVNGRGNFE